MDDSSAIAVVASYAGILTFLILVIIEGQRRQSDRITERLEMASAEDKIVELAGYLGNQVFAQALIVFVTIGVFACTAWLLMVAFGVSANNGVRIGPIVLSAYVLVAVLVYALLQVKILQYLSTQAGIIKKARK